MCVVLMRQLIITPYFFRYIFYLLTVVLMDKEFINLRPEIFIVEDKNG